MTTFTDTRLREIEARHAAATPGPHYIHNPDDSFCMNALYISDAPGEMYPFDENIDAARVLAITLLQQPRMAVNGKFDENTEFFGHAWEDIRDLLTEVRRLRGDESPRDLPAAAIPTDDDLRRLTLRNPVFNNCYRSAVQAGMTTEQMLRLAVVALAEVSERQEALLVEWSKTQRPPRTHGQGG